jgi:hypothetical protein
VCPLSDLHGERRVEVGRESRAGQGWRLGRSRESATVWPAGAKPSGRCLSMGETKWAGTNRAGHGPKRHVAWK